MEQSPCVRICTLNSDKICIGCGRNSHEIQHWSSFSDEEKRTIKSHLKERLNDILLKLRAKRKQSDTP